MIHEVEISPEIVKLAQHRTRTMGAALNDELARKIAEEAIYSLDPESGLLLEDENAYSSNDALAAAFGVNDVVINGKRLDVRAIDEEGRVSVSRALVGTSYLSLGTLAVQLSGSLHGKVVAFVPAAEWESVDKSAGDQQVLFVKPKSAADFNLAVVLAGLAQPVSSGSTRAPGPFELATFVANRAQLSVAKQRAIAEGVLRNAEMWSEIEQIVSTWCKGTTRRVLSDSGLWNRRIEKVTELVAPKFKRVPREDVRKIVARLGESFGGQPESPAFRKALLSSLTREELAQSLGGAALKKALAVAEAVLSGRAVHEAVKEVARNPVAVQIAAQIKIQRKKTGEFVEATAQELAGAFQQLALQPAYATHSSDPASGIESINEALKMLDAAEVAERAQALDDELARL